MRRMRDEARRRWQARLYDMKRDWRSFLAEAEARGHAEEAALYRVQLVQIDAMLEAAGADPSLNPPRHLDS